VTLALIAAVGSGLTWGGVILVLVVVALIVFIARR